MKKIILLITCAMLALSLAACGGATESVKTQTSATQEPKETTKETEATVTEETNVTSEDTTAEQPTESGKDVLVVYFSATGTTKDVAEKIAKITNGDVYEIVPEQPYTSDDLNWNDKNSRTTKEQNDSKSRPGIASEPVSLEGYKTIYIGYPIWWGEAPRIMDTFVEKYNFDGKTVIPFCTSGGSGIGRSGKILEENAGSGNWLDGKRFGAGPSEDDVRSWISGIQ